MCFEKEINWQQNQTVFLCPQPGPGRGFSPQGKNLQQNLNVFLCHQPGPGPGPPGPNPISSG